MMKLNKQLEDWIIFKFFKKHSVVKYAGWYSIASALINKGECLTTEAATNIWNGGIGNFITYEEVPDSVGLIKLIFDRDSFFSEDCDFLMNEYKSEQSHRERTIKEFMEAQKEFNSLLNIIKPQ